MPKERTSSVPGPAGYGEGAGITARDMHRQGRRHRGYRTVAAREQLDALMAKGAQELERILAGAEPGERLLIPILQRIQTVFGYLPGPALEITAERLRIPLSRIYGVATFYSQFHLIPRGRHIVRVCAGTACHVRGGAGIYDELCKQLGVVDGGTTTDLAFTLEKVACLGACGMAPAMMVDDEAYGRLTPEKVRQILTRVRDDDVAAAEMGAAVREAASADESESD